MAVAFVILEEEASLRRERVFFDKTNPLETMDNVRLIKKYRLPKVEIEKIIRLCQPKLERETGRNHALPVHVQVLGALRFFGKGMFQEDGGELVGMSQPSMSRAIENVTNILCDHASVFISFPTEPSKIAKIKRGFFQMKGCPNVIGQIDGTQIALKGPVGPEEPLYVGRKTGLSHTLNVQIICDDEMRITDIVSKWPGATHDSFVWKSFGIRKSFLQNCPNGILLGDSGYPNEPWLFTPYENPRTLQQRHYNRSHKSTRSFIERTIGLWKSRFRSIDLSGGRLLYKPRKTCKIIVATAVLHNIRRALHIPEDEEFEADPVIDPPHVAHPENSVTLAGNQARNLSVTNHF